LWINSFIINVCYGPSSWSCTYKTKNWAMSNTNPTKNQEWTQVLWHPSCYSSYKPGDKSWMRKGPKSVYKWNMSVVICVVMLGNFSLPFQTSLSSLWTWYSWKIAELTINNNRSLYNENVTLKECWPLLRGIIWYYFATAVHLKSGRIREVRAFLRETIVHV
jgi:hypothetical protein